MAMLARRLRRNVAGDFYVDARCIDCGTCRWMDPATFGRHGGQAYVHAQPVDAVATRAALMALVSCPTASIGTRKRHVMKPVVAAFPRLLEPGVYHCGFHHEASFGAASYLIVRPEGNVLVDSPRAAAPLLKNIEALGGVQMMFLTHRDDIADHQKIARRFGCTRILHHADVSAATREVEIQPRGSDPIALGPDLTLIPVPGHTCGSACLLYRNILFSGDHLAWNMEKERLTAFRDACWYDWRTQIASMRRLAAWDFERVLPGHGAPCYLSRADMARQLAACIRWMERQDVTRA